MLNLPKWFSLNATELKLFGVSMFLWIDIVMKYEKRKNKKEEEGEGRKFGREKKQQQEAI